MSSKLISKNLLFLFLIIISGVISYFGYKYHGNFNLDLGLFCGDGFTECSEVTQRMILFHLGYVFIIYTLIIIFLPKNSFLKNESDFLLLGVLFLFNILDFDMSNSSYDIYLYSFNFISLFYFLFFKTSQKLYLYISVLLYFIVFFGEILINFDIFYYNKNFEKIEKVINIILITLFLTFTVLQILRIRRFKTSK